MATESEGIEKSAILLLSLGKDEAAEVLKNLGPKEVQKLGHAMAALKQVARERVESVIDEFNEQTSRGSPASNKAARNMSPLIPEKQSAYAIFIQAPHSGFRCDTRSGPRQHTESQLI